jgi:hypothetical protein
MNSREIILANIEHTDTPIGMHFSFGMNDFHTMGLQSDYKQKRWTEDKVEYYDDEWGNIWVRMVGGSNKGEIHKPVLPQWSGLDDIVLPTHKSVEFPDTDKFKLLGIGGWVFDNARYLRKLENYLVDMALYPDEVGKLNKKVASVYENKIHLAGASGADGIMIGEDLGTQTELLFSPSMFQHYFKDEYTRLMGIAHEYGMKVFMHSCGQNSEIVEDLIDCGVDAFQFDQPAVYDMDWLSSVFSSRKVALYSPLDIQQFLPTGNRQIIESESYRMCDLFKNGLIAKNYTDLHGIGVDPSWDKWAYDCFLLDRNTPNH